MKFKIARKIHPCPVSGEAGELSPLEAEHPMKWHCAHCTGVYGELPFWVPGLTLPSPWFWKVWLCPLDIYQSGQITGSGTVPNMVQVYRIRYIQSHNASGKPKLFQIFNCQITEKCKFLLQVFPEYHFAHQKSQHRI